MYKWGKIIRYVYMVAKWFAEEIAKRKECTVVCSCGIHVDDITAEQIQIVTEKCRLLLQKIVEEIKNKECIS